MKRFLLGLVGVVAVGALIVGIVWLQWNNVTSDVPYFSPREWSWMDGAVNMKIAEKTGHLLIRRQLVRGPRVVTGKWVIPYWEDILKNRDQSWERKRRREKDAAPIPGVKSSRDLESEYCYDYDPATRNFDGVPCSLWYEEHGEVSPCAPLRCPEEYFQYGADPTDRDQVQTDISAVLPPGRAVQESCVAPSVPACSREVSTTNEPADRCPARLRQADRGTPQQAFAAVLSARRGKGGWGFWGAGPPTGIRSQHYHQIMRLSDSSIVGGRVRVPIVTRLDDDIASPGRDMLMGMGWSPDERFVVYTGRTSLCIVHVDE